MSLCTLEDPAGISIILCPFQWDRFSHWVKLGCQAANPRSPVSTFLPLSIGLQVYIDHIHIFKEFKGFELRSSSLLTKHCYSVAHLPSPQIGYFVFIFPDPQEKKSEVRVNIFSTDMCHVVSYANCTLFFRFLLYDINTENKNPESGIAS